MVFRFCSPVLGSQKVPWGQGTGDRDGQRWHIRGSALARAAVLLLVLYVGVLSETSVRRQQNCVLPQKLENYLCGTSWPHCWVENIPNTNPAGG